MDSGEERRDPEITAGCGCKGKGQLGKSQRMQDDKTTEDDIVGASNYERAESDQSKGIFARQTEAYNKNTESMLGGGKA